MTHCTADCQYALANLNTSRHDIQMASHNVSVRR